MPMAELVLLVVDDDPTVSESLSTALSGSPLRVEVASNAELAMQMLSARSYGGLVLDVVLDDGSGFDVLRFMERQNITVPTIVVTQKLPAYVREMLPFIFFTKFTSMLWMRIEISFSTGTFV